MRTLKFLCPYSFELNARNKDIFSSLMDEIPHNDSLLEIALFAIPRLYFTIIYSNTLLYIYFIMLGLD